MVKDGEHDKTQMVNKFTFNNNNNNNYNYDDNDDDGNTITSDLPMSLYSFSAEIWPICQDTCMASSANYLLMHVNALIW